MFPQPKRAGAVSGVAFRVLDTICKLLKFVLYL